MYEIELTASAKNDLRALRKRDQRLVVDGIEKQLEHEPTRETRNRKRLRPNQLAEWEVRVDRFRVFYDVDDAVKMVKVAAVGYKNGDRLIIRNKEFEL